jgi:outer membrane protein insertion porin family
MMNQLLRRCSLAGMVTFLWVAAWPASAQVRVGKITVRHLGPPAASEEFIRSNIRIKEGETLNRNAENEDVRTLYNTGLFYNIRVKEEMTADRVNLIYEVEGRPSIAEIKFQGNHKYSDSKLLRKISCKVGEPLNDHRLFTNKMVLLELYQKAGLSKTDVRYKVDIDENAGRCVVTFEVTETPKVKIIDVVFEPARAFPQKKLRSVLKTRRSWMFAWLTGAGKLKDEQFEDDKDRLSDFYHNAGYIDFELKEVKYDYPASNRLVLRFIISEGRQYRVGTIGLQGVTLFPTNDILKGLRMKPGSLFTPQGLARDQELLQDYFGSKGYIDTRVAVRKLPNLETGTMDLVYLVIEAERVYIEKIEIKGNNQTKDKVIRRELAVAPGEVFDMTKVRLSKKRLEEMNYFDRVETRPEETDVPNRRNLVVTLDEKSTGNASVGAGFDMQYGLIGQAVLTEGNFDLFKFKPPYFRGGGDKLRLSVGVGLQFQEYRATYVKNWFLDKHLTFEVDLYHRNTPYVEGLWGASGDYRAGEQRTGVKLSLTRALLGTELLRGTLSTTFERIGINGVGTDAPQSFYDSQGSYIVGRLGASIAYDTRNSAMLPSWGQRTILSSELVGGDFQLYKLDLRTAWYFPGFAEGHIWEFTGRIGVMDLLGKGVWENTSPNSLDPPRQQTPWFERYFLGGPSTLRGFRYRDVGPQEIWINNQGSSSVGGNSYFMLSAEYSVPVFQSGRTSLRFAVFSDMGNVYGTTYHNVEVSGRVVARPVYRGPFDFDFGSFSADAGIGLRLNLPIGPLRLDYGWAIRKANGEHGDGAFQFSVGYTRNF